MFNSSGILCLSFEDLVSNKVHKTQYNCLSFGSSLELQVGGVFWLKLLGPWFLKRDVHVWSVLQIFFFTLPQFLLGKTEVVRLPCPKEALWNGSETNIGGRTFKTALEQSSGSEAPTPSAVPGGHPCTHTQRLSTGAIIYWPWVSLWAAVSLHFPIISQ